MIACSSVSTIIIIIVVVVVVLVLLGGATLFIWYMCTSKSVKYTERDPKRKLHPFMEITVYLAHTQVYLFLVLVTKNEYHHL